jgi:hypothetical protein
MLTNPQSYALVRRKKSTILLVKHSDSNPTLQHLDFGERTQLVVNLYNDPRCSDGSLLEKYTFTTIGQVFLKTSLPRALT